LNTKKISLPASSPLVSQLSRSPYLLSLQGSTNISEDLFLVKSQHSTSSKKIESAPQSNLPIHRNHILFRTLTMGILKSREKRTKSRSSSRRRRQASTTPPILGLFEQWIEDIRAGLLQCASCTWSCRVDNRPENGLIKTSVDLDELIARFEHSEIQKFSIRWLEGYVAGTVTAETTGERVS
jgi:hypothetical protein